MSTMYTVSDKLCLWKINLSTGFEITLDCASLYARHDGPSFELCALRMHFYNMWSVSLSPLRVRRSKDRFSGGCKSKIMKRLSWFWIFFPPAIPSNTLSLSCAHKQQITKMGCLLQVMEVGAGSRRCLFCPSPKVQVQGCSVCPESVITRSGVLTRVCQKHEKWERTASLYLDCSIVIMCLYLCVCVCSWMVVVGFCECVCVCTLNRSLY